VCLTVADTGSGMTADVLARIFTPFFTTKDIGKGTGLGLSTVLGIVSESGGGLRVTSHPGTGSRFEVFLPQVSGAALMHETRREQPASASSEPLRVLVVEDEDLLRQLAARVLKEAGHTVLTAENGRQALAVLDQQAGGVDVVMTDVVMPEIGGRDLAGEIGLRYPQVPVLFTSGYLADPDSTEWLSRSPSAFLPKPYSPETLVRTIRDVVDRHRAALTPRSG
jgi:CheY-like chemotaxis protein